MGNGSLIPISSLTKLYYLTGDDNSCIAAAEVLKAKNVKLYALVNNAGLFLNTNPEMMSKFPKILMSTNYMGPKRVTEAMIDIIDPLEGRIVNTSSDSGPEWLARQDEKTKNFFTKPELTMAELDLAIKSWCDLPKHTYFIEKISIL
jgi:NAD(P)-dependent dehydrogenase (short-subunit alcohol dehydrogenase family)